MYKIEGGNNLTVYPMKGIHNRLDYVEVIAHLLSDVKTSVAGINTHELDLDLDKIKARSRHEGSSFFTKTLPTLGKALDRALLGDHPLDCGRWCKLSNTKLPRFLGELFKRVFSPVGEILVDPSIQCIHALRDIAYLFYKYEIPHSQTQSSDIIAQFVATEESIFALSCNFALLDKSDDHTGRGKYVTGPSLDQGTEDSRETDPEYLGSLVESMRKDASRVFCSLNLTTIDPNHGPGVVSTREKGPEKYVFRRISARLEAIYPYTEYNVFNINDPMVSLSSCNQLVTTLPSARVILVPKDSRGPRLISCEPLENQWIQQGIKDKLVKLLETHRETCGHVNFTDQTINRNLALLGSVDGTYCTLDLKDASDRVSVELVKRVFPSVMVDALMACRTDSTQLPDGRVLTLAKFAPMGSALCFPILASLVWLALTSGRDACSRKTTYVYGDDIIVQRTDVPRAIKRLEAVGLLVNRHKSCTSGFFRESCGMDAYKGIPVTPFRLRKVWHHRPRPETIVSYIEKSNAAYHRGYHCLANFLARLVATSIRFIPYNLSQDSSGDCLSGSPHFEFLPTPVAPNSSIHPFGECSWNGNDWFFSRLRSKESKSLQKRVYYLPFLMPKKQVSLRERENYFRALHRNARKHFSSPGYLPSRSSTNSETSQFNWDVEDNCSASVYTHNRASKLVRKWR